MKLLAVLQKHADVFLENISATLKLSPWWGLWAVAMISLAFVSCDNKPGTNKSPDPPKFQIRSPEVEKTFYPIVNLPALMSYRQDFGDVDSPDGDGKRKPIWTGIGVSRNREKVNEHLEKLKSDGVQGVVWFLFADGGATPDFNRNGDVIGLEPTAVEDYKAAVELATVKHGLSVIWVVIDHKFMFPEEKKDDGARLYGHADVIEEEAKRMAFFERALTPLLKMYPDNERISWIIINEPEVALEQGYVKEEELNKFIEEAIKRVKQHTTQSVSVGHRYLESLIEFKAGKPNITYDFYNFHHYSTYLPMDAKSVSTLLGGPAKPIYIGEFNLNTNNQPSIPWGRSKFVDYARKLGFAGVWPWALNPNDAPPLSFGDVAQIAGFTNQAREQLRDISPSEWSMAAQQSIDEINRQIPGWQSDLDVKNREIGVNQPLITSTQGWITRITTRLDDEQRTLSRLQSQHTINLANLAASRQRIADMRKTGNYDPRAMSDEVRNEADLSARCDQSKLDVDKAQASVNKSQNELEEQNDLLKNYQQKVRLNAYQSRMLRFRIDLANRTALPYWRGQAGIAPTPAPAINTSSGSGS